MRSTKTRDMNATVDALTDLEHRLTQALSDALSAAECARLSSRLGCVRPRAEERIVRAKSAAGRITAATLLVAVPAGGVMRITPEHLLLGVLWLAVTLFVIAAIVQWG